MKLLSFRRPDGDPSWGIAKDEGVIDLGHLAPSLKHAIWASTSLAELASRHADYKLSDVRFLPPIPDPDKILCVGLNYVSHIKEGGREPPPKPIIFARFANSQVGHGETLIRPKASETYDYEGELAVVIGQRCRHVPKENAWDVIGGYACYNEGSVREWQRHSAQFIPGKNFYHSGGFGPWIVTPEEAGDITTADSAHPPERGGSAARHHRRPLLRYPNSHQLHLHLHRAGTGRCDRDRHDRRRRRLSHAAAVDEAR